MKLMKYWQSIKNNTVSSLADENEQPEVFIYNEAGTPSEEEILIKVGSYLLDE